MFPLLDGSRIVLTILSLGAGLAASSSGAKLRSGLSARALARFWGCLIDASTSTK
jgi:hypothetical protein